MPEIAALRREQQLIWEAHVREHGQHEQAHNREHRYTDDALKLAAELAKETKASANEWRGAMNDREARFATRDELNAVRVRVESIEATGFVTAERERNRLETQAEMKRQDERRQSREQWIVGIIVGIVVLVINVLIRLASG